MFLPIVALAGDTDEGLCFDDAGRKYGIESELIRAVGKISNHSCNQDKVFDNGTGSKNYGCMQINSRWFEKFEAMGIDKKHIIENKCVNIAVGAWILRKNIDSAKGDLWEGVGYYFGGMSKKNEELRKVFIKKVKKEYEKIKN